MLINSMNKYIFDEFQLLIKALKLIILYFESKLQVEEKNPKMGCDHYFYVLPLLAYTKLIKPKLIQMYGPVSRFAILRQEQRRKQLASFFQNIGKSSFMMGKRSDEKETPFQRFFKIGAFSFYYAQKDPNSFEELRDLLKQESIYQNDQRNDFLRYDEFLPYMGLFDETGTEFKVCNMDQVEIFIEYIEAIKKAYGEESMSSSLVREYSGCVSAGEIFGEVLEKMKSEEQETVLILHRAG